METLVRSKDGYLMGQQKPQDSYVSNNFGSLEDFVSVMVKQEQDKVKLPEGDLGSCEMVLDCLLTEQQFHTCLLQSLEGNEKGHSGLVEEGQSSCRKSHFWILHQVCNLRDWSNQWRTIGCISM
ncbi:hypothetical protein OIU76_008718 [Salix suchowensis]|nr:hypothetical protein OIU76_008718 [Salix suchowensis]